MGDVMEIQQTARFSLGRVVATPGALQALETAGMGALPLLARHQSGDFGAIDAEDWKANEKAIQQGWRVFSSYPLGQGKIWIITEADRSITTLLLPEEY